LTMRRAVSSRESDVLSSSIRVVLRSVRIEGGGGLARLVRLVRLVRVTMLMVMMVMDL